ncbi:SDR family oxidoreductase [Aromatoleum aromaticum]|uniref:Sugar dehydratase n=1 Tax=Aromatoleum aromaticum (strain DSM 19018 / LMG 30748 / EbN1) TaxID=76114 RepID=Q5P694_AROAE|nr:SDR family oxidoreductase [Aromatoleum aromaticum]NMG54883.1 NAD-dependent epimerase/dehydratase family protein [Aromatoleum aromaticum]CAI07167.1 Sugar dehydratase [Aromatoleum aromaticum EbN1]
MAKRILIIGGSYFSGRVFVEEALKMADAELHVFNRGNLPLRMERVTEHVGNREHPDRVREGIPDGAWDAVVDFCAYTPAHVETLLRNLRGTVRQYLLISTTTVYQQSAGRPVDENAPLLDGPQPELGDYADYGYDKCLAERAARRECERLGIALTVLRPAIIYGYYNYAPRETYFFDRLRNREPVVIPEPARSSFNFIWVVDMAHLLWRCIGDPRVFGETFNLASGEAVTHARIVEALGEIVGKTIETLPLPVEEIARRNIPLPFPLDEHLLYSGAKIDRLFGFEHTPFRAGLREALKYYLMTKRRQEALAGEAR